MVNNWRQETQPIILEGGITMPYSWTVGRVGSRFFIELRDTGRIMGNRCKECAKVWVPPRLRCPICLKLIEDHDWLEVGPEGTLRHFTIVRYEHPAQPIKAPFAYGIVDLDGATQAITHFVYYDELESLQRGMRMKPVLAAEREGNILDILYFEPTGEKP